MGRCTSYVILHKIIKNDYMEEVIIGLSKITLKRVLNCERTIISAGEIVKN